MKNTLGNLVDSIVYYGYTNGMCYSGELKLENVKRKKLYVIKRAIPVQFPDYNKSITLYIDEDKIDRIVGPNIYIKQEKDMSVKELEDFILFEKVTVVTVVDESIVAPF